MSKVKFKGVAYSRYYGSNTYLKSNPCDPSRAAANEAAESAWDYSAVDNRGIPEDAISYVLIKVMQHLRLQFGLLGCASNILYVVF